MSTLRANTLKPITSGNSLVLQGDSGGSGVSGPSIDSNGDVDFTQNTNAKVKLPSGGGIYESDGSTEILTESSGVVTLKNAVIDQTVSMASSGLTVRNITNVSLASDQELSNSTTLTTFFSPTYTPLFSGSKVQGILTLVGAVWNTASGNGLKRLRIEFTGTGITDYTTADADNLGGNDYGNSGIEIGIHQTIVGGLITTSTTDVITANVKAQNRVTAFTTKWKFLGDGTTAETFFTWIEYK